MVKLSRCRSLLSRILSLKNKQTNKQTNTNACKLSEDYLDQREHNMSFFEEGEMGVEALHSIYYFLLTL